VIDDSIPWKDELVKVANRLEAKTKQKRWTDRTGYLIERDFIVSAYAMRKLIESHKVSDELGQRQIPVRRFDLTGTPPHPLSPTDIADSYDFENGRRRTLSVVDLCHEIIRSVVFTFYCGETTDNFDGVYVSSDCHKTEFVYLVLASDFIALCSDIGVEDVRSQSSGHLGAARGAGGPGLAAASPVVSEPFRLDKRRLHERTVDESLHRP
jgi:hypothetical protein